MPYPVYGFVLDIPVERLMVSPFSREFGMYTILHIIHAAQHFLYKWFPMSALSLQDRVRFRLFVLMGRNGNVA